MMRTLHKMLFMQFLKVFSVALLLFVFIIVFVDIFSHLYCQRHSVRQNFLYNGSLCSQMHSLFGADRGSVCGFVYFGFFLCQ